MKLENTEAGREHLKKRVGADKSYYTFDDTFEEYSPRSQHVVRWVVRNYCAPFSSAGAFGRAILDFFPVLKWLPAYSWRENFFYDLISGITTGVILVPQGIAYSYLAGVEPVYGLYSSFFAPLFYIIFGCSPHVSRGPSSVLGIMSGVSNEQIRSSYAESLAMHSAFNASLEGVSGGSDLPIPDAITVASMLTFTVGLIQLFLGLIRLDFAADYFSEALVGGYTLAAAIHVLIPQTSALLGISLCKGSTPGYLFKVAYELVTRLFEANFVSTMISAFGVIFLIASKDVVNPWINRRSRIKISLPYELILMVVGTVMSQYFEWSSRYKIKVVGEVPKGLPMLITPRLDMLVYVLPNAIAIAMVTLAMHFSMVKLFASRMHYTVDSSQELYAIGLGSLLSGCFPVYPTSTALGRSLVMVESGAKSQLSTAVSCVLVLTVILWFGPLFRSLPQCILYVVVIVALRPIFRKAPEIRQIWNLSRYDGIIWIVSLVATVMTNVITGLGIAIVFALFTVIFRTQWPAWSSKFSRCSYTPEESSSKSTNSACASQALFAEYCVFRFDSVLLFTNAQRFEKYICQTLRRWRTIHATDNGNSYELLDSEKYRLFVFDFATTTQVDVAGLTTLSKCITRIICEKYAEHIAFIHCHEGVRESLLKAEIVANIDDSFFPSLAEALHAFRKLLRYMSTSRKPAVANLLLAVPETTDRATSVETLIVRQSNLSISPPLTDAAGKPKEDVKYGTLRSSSCSSSSSYFNEEDCEAARRRR